jgi:hypothetical protein
MLLCPTAALMPVALHAQGAATAVAVNLAKGAATLSPLSVLPAPLLQK